MRGGIPHAIQSPDGDGRVAVDELAIVSASGIPEIHKSVKGRGRRGLGTFRWRACEVPESVAEDEMVGPEAGTARAGGGG